jgi:hypothetical protein
MALVEQSPRRPQTPLRRNVRQCDRWGLCREVRQKRPIRATRARELRGMWAMSQRSSRERGEAQPWPWDVRNAGFPDPWQFGAQARRWLGERPGQAVGSVVQFSSSWNRFVSPDVPCHPGTMTASKERKRQKKLERSRKKRQVAQERARDCSASLIPRRAEIAGLARSGAFGPEWTAEGYDDVDVGTAFLDRARHR